MCLVEVQVQLLRQDLETEPAIPSMVCFFSWNQFHEIFREIDFTKKNKMYFFLECSELGGSSAGSCASGFGVCCLFATSTCGSTVSHNCSYVR